MERISTREAARRLGVSATQIRRLIAAGKLQAEEERRPQGTRLRVLWDATHEATPDATHTHQEGTSTPHDAATVATPDATHVARIEDEVRWLRERLERAEEERAELRRMLNLEQQTVAQLRRQLPGPRTTDAPEDATDAPATPAPVTSAPGVPRPPRRRGFFARLFGL